MGISQEKLAASLDRTFQQLQKYEKGANRISASMLVRIAAGLECTVAYLFAGCGPGSSHLHPEEIDFPIDTRENLDLIRNFQAITCPQKRTSNEHCALFASYKAQMSGFIRYYL